MCVCLYSVGCTAASSHNCCSIAAGFRCPQQSSQTRGVHSLGGTQRRAQAGAAPSPVRAPASCRPWCHRCPQLQEGTEQTQCTNGKRGVRGAEGLLPHARVAAAGRWGGVSPQPAATPAAGPICTIATSRCSRRRKGSGGSAGRAWQSLSAHAPASMVLQTVSCLGALPATGALRKATSREPA